MAFYTPLLANKDYDIVMLRAASAPETDGSWSEQDGSVRVETGGGKRSKLELRRIQAVACAVVEDVSANPVLIIDLLLNWRDTEGEVLKVVRLLSNSFDPGVLLPNAGAGMQALRNAVQRLQTGAGAEALPSAAALAGQPFPRFGRLADYEREVLDVGS